MSESIRLARGDSLPLSLTLPDGLGGLGVRAFVYDSAGSPVVGSPFNLPEIVGTGRYADASAFTPGGVGVWFAIYLIYTDVTYTILDTSYERDSDSFTVKDDLGLLGRNQAFTVLTRQPDGNELPLTGRLRTYDTQANAIADTGAGLLEEYDTVSTYDVGDNTKLIKHVISQVGT